MENVDLFYVYSLNYAKKLINKGYEVIEIKPNKKYRHYNVFCFEKTLDFMNSLNELIIQDKK